MGVAHEAGGDLGHVGDGRHGGVMILRRQHTHSGAGGLGRAADQRGGASIGLRDQGDHPRTALEEVDARGDRARPLAPRHRVPPDIALEAGHLARGELIEHDLFDGGDIGDDGVRPLGQRPGHHLRRDIRRRGHHDEIDRISRAKASPAEVRRERFIGR